MTTMEVQTSISPATLLRMYRAQAYQEMYGGAIYGTNGHGQLRSFEAPTSLGYRVGGAADAYGYVNIPLALDQSAVANRVPPLDWYPQQYVSSSDALEKKKTEYEGFKEQWIRATLSQYK